ncbi:DDE family transposase [Streptomyces sp. Ag109_O5-1]|uniref:transposase family protein n=1 Tax=Streptomyces sp. Ag109_O5-1 TaxID=1938851 RepID=UPI000F507EAA|nr:DDE family transposase [Streptomyces sp. Ag109_O5-1]
MCRPSATVCLVKSPARQHCVTGPLAKRLATLADPRCRRGKRHPFVAVLLIACSAVMTGARSFVAIDKAAIDARQEVLARLVPATQPPWMCASRPAVRRPAELSRALLDPYDPRGVTVTGDALHTLRDHAASSWKRRRPTTPSP